MMSVPSAQLRARFAKSAGHHARKAVEAYGEASYADFYLHAGTALELAIKARLVGEHGIHCIAPDKNGWFKAMLLIARDIDGSSGDRPQTVSATDALRRLQLLEPDLPIVFSQNVIATIERRNVGAHVGHAGSPSDEELLTHAAAFVRAIGPLLKIEADRFWGELKGLASSLVEDELNAVKVRVEAALAGARARRALLTDEAFAAANEASIRDLEDEGPEVIGAPCPACHATGWAVGYVVDEGEGEAEDDHGELTWHWVPDMQLVLESFACRTCGLRLEDEEEITVGGLPARLPNDRASPGDAVEPEW